MADIVQLFPGAPDACRCSRCIAAARRFPRDPHQLRLPLPVAEPAPAQLVEVRA